MAKQAQNVAVTASCSRCQTVCKPGSVPPESGDGHSSGTFVAERLARPTRAAARKARPAARHAETACRSYLVLLPVGFALPPPLPAARCALTAPFHPYRPPPRRGATGSAVYFLWHFPWGRPRRALPGTVPPWSPDFPLPAKTSSLGGERPSDRLAWDHVGDIWASVKAGVVA